MRGDGRVFRRGTVWWVSFYIKGREYRKSSYSRKKKKAKKLLKLYRKIRMGFGIEPDFWD